VAVIVAGFAVVASSADPADRGVEDPLEKCEYGGEYECVDDQAGSGSCRNLDDTAVAETGERKHAVATDHHAVGPLDFALHCSERPTTPFLHVRVARLGHDDVTWKWREGLPAIVDAEALGGNRVNPFACSPTGSQPEVNSICVRLIALHEVVEQTCVDPSGAPDPAGPGDHD
jgi:hypothetical protein